MQDRYAGDIGDFGEIALLRHLKEGRRLAICWYLTKGDAKTKSDGKHIGYLTISRPNEFRHLAPELFDALKDILSNSRESSRSLAALEASGLLGDANFSSDERLLPHDDLPMAISTPAWRSAHIDLNTGEMRSDGVMPAKDAYGSNGIVEISADDLCWGIDQRPEQSAAAQDFASSLNNEIDRLLQEGKLPGRNVPWKTVYDELRDRTGGWADKDAGLPLRGFGDKSIQRRVKRRLSKIRG
jgi:hypothetical protein